MKKCSICGYLLKEKPFLYINAGGESILAKISILDYELLLCLECSKKLMFFLNNMCLTNNIFDEKDNKHKKVLKFPNI